MPQVIVNVPMPSELKKAVDQLVARGWYASASEVIREGTRRVVKSSPRLTVNGFTEEFENQVLKAAQEPIDQSTAIETEGQLEEYLSGLINGAKTLK